MAHRQFSSTQTQVMSAHSHLTIRFGHTMASASTIMAFQFQRAQNTPTRTQCTRLLESKSLTMPGKALTVAFSLTARPALESHSPWYVHIPIPFFKCTYACFYFQIGYGANVGIVPISCAQIFERIRAQTNATKSYQVQLSILEIYNEKVQDLLLDPNTRPRGGLKIREHKTLGVYVQDLGKHPVDSYEAIEEKMDEGQRNRSIGSTQMNATSSRAHTVITIEFK